MSSKQNPEPPKLTSAKVLMKQKAKPQIPVQIAVEEPKPVKPELGSIFSTVPVIPQKVEAVEEIPETEASSLMDNENSEATDISDTSELTAVTGNTEDTVDRNYGGPWGIIKHTGYVTVAVWAVLTAAATGAAAYFFAPGDYTWIALGVLGFMSGVIAAVDRKTRLIKNQHTVLTAILTVPLSLLVAINLNAWNILFGFIAAVLVFGVFIFLILKVNFGSGGDIKFSPVPAFALGVVNPLISALWLFYALIITVVLLVVRKEKATSFGEGMAISLPLAIASVFALYSLSGLPYMEPLSL